MAHAQTTAHGTTQHAQTSMAPCDDEKVTSRQIHSYDFRPDAHTSCSSRGPAHNRYRSPPKAQQGKGTFRPAAADSSDCDENTEDNTCPICLETIPASVFGKITLLCSHTFCVSCITQYAETRPDHANSDRICCPCCRADVRKPGIISRSVDKILTAEQPQHRWVPRVDHRIEEMPSPIRHQGANQSLGWESGWSVLATPGVPARQRPLDQLRAARRPGSAEGRSAPWWRQGPRDSTARAAQQAELASAAGGLELRVCPSCATPISKNGGCDHMVCPCGARFNWSAARPLRPCTRCHYHPDASFRGRWKTCPHCSPRAKAQATACSAAASTAMVPVYATMGTVGVTAAAVAFSGAVAVSAVPAAIFGPLALAYEPIRRSTKSLRGTPNRFGWAAASGLAISAIAIGSMISYDSD